MTKRESGAARSETGQSAEAARSETGAARSETGHSTEETGQSAEAARSETGQSDPEAARLGDRPQQEASRWPSLGRYVALVTLDHGGEFVLPGEAVELDIDTAQRLLELGFVEIWPGKAHD